MLIYLLRHGLTEYNAQKRYQGQRDIPLSAEGLSQLRRADIDPKVGLCPEPRARAPWEGGSCHFWIHRGIDRSGHPVPHGQGARDPGSA
mgnify:CR=1 FL=1